MFERFISFLTGIPAREDLPDGEDPRVAAAALLFHVMEADGAVLPEEEKRLRETLAQAFKMTGPALDALIHAGRRAEQQSVDFYGFTSVIKRHFDAGQRTELIGLMWEIVYADGVRNEVEDNVVWRVAELLDVERQDRIALRRLVEGKVPDDEAARAYEED